MGLQQICLFFQIKLYVQTNGKYNLSDKFSILQQIQRACFHILRIKQFKAHSLRNTVWDKCIN